jgi:hypothetical protein
MTLGTFISIVLLSALALGALLYIDARFPRVSKILKWLIAAPLMPLLWPYLIATYKHDREAAARMNTDEAVRIVASAGRTPYDILGVRPGSSDADLKRAFRKRAMESHPDRMNQHGLSKAEAEARFKEVSAAYKYAAQ